MDKLPAVVKSRAMGGPDRRARALTSMAPGLTSPENTFALLKDLLQGLESRLQTVRTDVDKRNQLAAATPSIWPTHGWLSSSMGNRADPFTGERDFHPGLDISADKGDPIYSTADGKVTHAASAGNYGNLVIVDHGYGIETRYGHMSAFKVTGRPGGEARRSARPRRLHRPRHQLAPPLRSARQRPDPQSAPAAAESAPQRQLDRPVETVRERPRSREPEASQAV